MKKIALLLLFVTLMMGASAQKIYEIPVNDVAGKETTLAEYKGKVMLIVNTATLCGFTPQYKELEELYERYREQGLEILDFPCNQFGEQAPGTVEEIHKFCSANFNIQFPLFDKVEVNGEQAAPLFVYLKSQQGFRGFDLDDRLGALLDKMLRQQDTNYDKSPDIKWNFTKFLVSRDGQVLKRYEPTAKISDIEADIKAAL